MTFSLTYISPQNSDLQEYPIDINDIKSVLVVLNEKDHTRENSDLLSKIFNAINLDENKDVTKICLSEIQYVHELAWKVISGKKIIAFGVEPEVLSLHIVTHYYHPLTIGSHTYLFAHHLSDLNKERKVKLWSSLKQWFHVQT